MALSYADTTLTPCRERVLSTGIPLEFRNLEVEASTTNPDPDRHPYVYNHQTQAASGVSEGEARVRVASVCSQRDLLLELLSLELEITAPLLNARMLIVL